MPSLGGIGGVSECQAQVVPEIHWQRHIVQRGRLLEKRCHLRHGQSGVAAPDSCDQEPCVGVCCRIVKEPLNTFAQMKQRHRLNAVGGGDGVGIALATLGLSHDSTEVLQRLSCRATVVVAVDVASEHEHLVGSQSRHHVRCHTVAVVVIAITHPACGAFGAGRASQLINLPVDALVV